MQRARSAISFLTFCLFMAVGLSLIMPKGAFAQASRDTLRVALVENYAPFSFRRPDGRIAGYLVDFWTLWSKQTGRTVKLEMMEWSKTLPALRDGHVDIHSGLFKSDERDQWMAFSLPVGEIASTIYIDPASGLTPTLANLSGKRVATVRDSFQTRYLQLNHPELALVMVESTKEGIAAIFDKEADAYFGEIPPATEELSRLGGIGLLRRNIGEPVLRNALQAGVRLENAELLQEVDAGISGLDIETLINLERRWFSSPDDRYFDRLIKQLALSDEEKRWIEANPAINVAVSDFIVPIDIVGEDGSYTGFNADLLNLIARDTGLKIIPQFYSKWTDVVQSVTSGDVHMGLSLSRTPEREKSVDFTPAYAVDPIVVVVRNGSAEPTSLNDLKGKKVSIVKGMAIEGLIQEAVGESLTFYGTEQEAATALLGGEVDFHVSNLLPYGQGQRKSPNPMLKIAFRLAGEGGALRIGVHKTHPELHSIMRKTLATIGEDSLQRLRDKWLEPPQSIEVDGITFSAEQAALLSSKKPIRIGVDATWPPFSFVDSIGISQGISVEIVEKAAEKLGLKIELVPGKWADLVADLNDGKIDALADMSPSPDRRERYAMTSPYLEIPHVLVAAKSATDLNNEADLHHRTVALEEGYRNVEYFRKFHPMVHLKLFENTREALRAVARGEADAYAGNQAVASYILREEVLLDLEIKGEIGNDGSQLSIGVGGRDVVLADLLDKALRNVSKQEKLKIVADWIGGYSDTKLELTAEEREWLQTNPRIRVHNESDWPPFNFATGGTPRGFSIDYMNELAEIAGLNIDYITGPTWGEFLDMAKSGDLEVMLNIINTPERREYLLFTDSYVVNPNTILSRKGEPYRSVEELKGKKVSVVKGFFYEEVLKRDYPEVEMVLVANTLETMKAVQFGKADAALGELSVLKYLMSENLMTGLELSGEVNIGDPSLTKLNIATRKDLPELHGILMKAMAAMDPTRVREMRERWIQADENDFMDRLTSQEVSFLADHPEIRVGDEFLWAPFSFQDENGEFAGISAGYLDAIAERTGTSFTPEFGMDREAVVQAAKDGRMDILPAVSATDERLKFLMFTNSYGEFPIVIATRNDGPFADNLSALEGLRVAVVGETAFYRRVTADYPNLQIEAVQSAKDGLSALNDGEMDAFIGNLAAITYWTERQTLTNVKIAAPTDYTFELSIGVRPELAGLVPILNKALADIGDQERRAIKNAWIGVDVQFGLDLVTVLIWVLPAGGVVAVILIFIIWSNRKLQQSVREREVAEIALLENERQLQSIMDNSGAMIMVKDLDGNYIRTNVPFREFYGLDEGLLVAPSIEDVMPADKAARVREVDADVIRTRKRRSYEIIVPGAKETKTFLTTSFALSDQNGEVYGVCTIATDITALKEEQARVARSERRAFALLEAAPDATLIVGEDGMIDFANNQSGRVFGYEPNELVGSKIDILIPEAKRAGHDKLREGFMQDQSARPMGAGLELEALRKSGDTFPAEITLSPIETEDGVVVAASVRDVTERKRAEEKLRESEAQMQVILESSPAATSIIDTDGTFEFVNYRTVQMLNAEREEDLLGLDSSAFYASSEEKQRVIDALKRDGIVENFPVIHRRMDGTAFDALVTIIPTQFENTNKLVAYAVDVSELTEIQRELEATKQELESQFDLVHTVIESVDQGVVLRDAELKLQLFNSKFLELFGIPEGQFQSGVDFRDVLRYFIERGDFGDENPEEAFERRVTSTIEAAKSGKPEQREISKNSAGRILDLRSNPISGGRHVMTYTDITERKEAEKQLRAQHQLITDIVNSLGQGVGAFDAEGKLLVWNTLYREILGFSEDALYSGRSLLGMIEDLAKRGYYGPGDAKEQATERFTRLMNTQRARTEMLSDHKAYDVISNPTPQGGIVVSYTDITERKAVEAKIAQTLSELEAVLESVDYGVVMMNASQDVLVYNRAFVEIWKIDREKLAERPKLADLIRYNRESALYDVPADEFDQYVADRCDQIAKGAIPPTIFERSDGVVLLYQCIELPDDGRMLTYFDITDRIEQERELEQARLAAEDAAKAKSDFLATMSHEIRTPMNGVMTMADILDQTRLTGDQREMTRTIRQSAEALLTVINDILDFSKIEAGKLAIERVPFDMTDLTEGVLDLLAPRAEARGLMLLQDLVEPLPQRLVGDGNRVRQILLNLGGNATKFTEDGHVTVRIRRVPTDGQSYRMRFEIQDTGIGMTEEQVGNLFQAFSQAESSTARRFGGTGLGLAISKRLTELMGGEIGVQSVPGEGSTFWFELPFELEDEAFTLPVQEISEAQVLLVGYRPQEAESFRKLLEIGGVSNVREIATEDDLENYEAGGFEPDLILMDGRPGVPSVVEWGRWIPEKLALSKPKVLITAPHMAASALTVEPSVFPAADLLGTMVVPVHIRRLWEYVAVSLGKLSLEALNAVSDEAVTYEPPSIEEARAHGVAVLVAEDNETNRMVIGRVLSRLGVAFEMAEDGEIALRMLDLAEYGLLLSDFHMPVMDGFELTRRIREKEAAEGGKDHLPIVALTADVLPETAQKCEEVGMDGYLRKPIELDRMEEVFRGFIPKMYELRTTRKSEPQFPDEPDADTSSAPAASAGGPRDKLAGVDPDIFDPDALVDAFGDFDADAADFVMSFLGTVQGEIEAINAAFEAEDHKKARDVSHAMKGASLSCGAMRLGRLMKDIQDALDDNDPFTADIYREGLEETYEELAEALEPLRG